MKDKLAKLNNVFKKYGFIGSIKKVFSYINANILMKINLKNKLDFMINKNKYKNNINDILNTKYDRIIIWRSSFGWNVPLYQRPQHIANNLAKQNCLVFYEITKMTDNVDTIKKEKENLYLVNFQNKSFIKLLLERIKNNSKPRYLQFYSTDWTLSINNVKEYMNNGYKIIYEYIDDINPALAGTKELPKNVKDKYEFAMHNKDIYIVVTADLLKDDVINKRGDEKLIFSTNGVDYDHFKKYDEKYKFEDEFLKSLSKPTICYYGAFAKWFDYDLIRKINETDKYNIILFGVKYDESFDNSKINELKNVYFLGSKDYKVLKNYAKKIDIMMIPFVINDITKATSPVKIFEYMALHKPIVTTNMNECQKYKSVLIGLNHQEFIKKLDEAYNLKDNKEYINLLDKEAQDNDWFNKAKAIVDELKKGEV